MPRKNWGTAFFPNYGFRVIKYCAIYNEIQFYASSHQSINLDDIHTKEDALVAVKNLDLTTLERNALNQAINWLYDSK